MRYTDLDHLPVYEYEDVTLGQDKKLKRAIRSTAMTHVVRLVEYHPRGRNVIIPSRIGLREILDTTDDHLDRIGKIRPALLSVVKYNWGLAKNNPATPHHQRDPGELIPGGFLLVARVEVIRPAEKLAAPAHIEVDSIFDQYFEGLGPNEPNLVDLGGAQCVKGPHTSVLVDIEPKLIYKNNF